MKLLEIYKTTKAICFIGMIYNLMLDLFSRIKEQIIVWKIQNINYAKL